ncbi:TetR family transcriptional regulator [Nakamurella sp. YIM 132087]|uniref:TetR family transcriptional regulator n=1 Tax=Nakamurella alba TaxID=2665158 RepID=A0A7K1FHH6_9ACTN|nr:TetR family transcriptional regulator [Nakamurella alba]MTD13572.1 TetR family transcriptional regulator [Nakamurella alba]
MTDKRSDIVAASVELVQQDGLAGLTQPRVARRIGLRQSHITYYFPTRDDLVAAVAASAVERRIGALARMLSAPTVEEKIGVLVSVLLDPGQTRVLLALTQIADTTPELRSHFGALAAGIGPIAADLLSAAGAEVSAEAIALLQTTSTGLAVVALANGAGDERTTILLLHRLVHSFPSRQTDKDPT